MKLSAVEGTTFDLGQIVATRGAVATIPELVIHQCLVRHAGGDWGDVSKKDWKSNDESLNDESRILSAYYTDDGVKFWIITEADRSSTTVLLPDEY